MDRKRIELTNHHRPSFEMAVLLLFDGLNPGRELRFKEFIKEDLDCRFVRSVTARAVATIEPAKRAEVVVRMTYKTFLKTPNIEEGGICVASLWHFSSPSVAGAPGGQRLST